MTETETPPTPVTSMEELQKGWPELKLRVGQLENEKSALQHENKSLRALLERVIDHRQKSHSELVLLLTALVSKLPINDVGVIVSKLVEHNNNVSQILAALGKGTAEVDMPQPTVLKDLEQTKRDLLAAIKPAVDELIQMDAPVEKELLQSLCTQPDVFFSPQMVRANRCFIKGQMPRERIVKEFGETALTLFNDVTTDPKLNPNPKPAEIVLTFKNDFESLLPQVTSLTEEKKKELLALHKRVQASKANNEGARSQKNAFQKMSFLVELLHFYQHQNTEAPDVVFAQRLPALIEQLVVTGPNDPLDEKLVVQAESLLGSVISPDHRLMIINNLGKGGGTGKTLKYALRLRFDKIPEMDQLIAEFLKHLIPAPPQRAPSPQAIASVLRLLKPDMQLVIVKSITAFDRLRKEDADVMARLVGKELGLQGLEEKLKEEIKVSPEQERQMVWGRIKEMVAQRQDPVAIACAIRDRLHAKYDSDEIKQSWLILIEGDPISLIRVFCQLPYLPNGSTDSVARAVMESYVTRLTHEKYASTYNKIANSLRNMYKAKPDSPTLVNFIALVKWVDPDAAKKVATDIGMPA